jgi:hypothetical protein
VENIPGNRDHHSGHHDHCSDDRGQPIGIIPERVIAIIPNLIGIIPEPVIGMPQNTDRHRPESALR